MPSDGPRRLSRWIGRNARRWLHGPVPDLLLGCGLLYALLFVVCTLFGPEVRAAQPSYVIPVRILLVSMPHYGGTLVRVYDQRRDRRSYALFSVWATLAIAALSLRRARARDLVPAAALALTQALWFSVPFGVK